MAMAGIGDMMKKAQNLLGDEKVQKHLKSEKAESISDNVLDRASDIAKKVSGGKHNDKIDGARDQADKRLGNE
jgi:hypothetical protein